MVRSPSHLIAHVRRIFPIILPLFFLSIFQVLEHFIAGKNDVFSVAEVRYTMHSMHACHFPSHSLDAFFHHATVTLP